MLCFMVLVSDNNPKSFGIKENVYPEDGSFAALFLYIENTIIQVYADAIAHTETKNIYIYIYIYIYATDVFTFKQFSIRSC